MSGAKPAAVIFAFSLFCLASGLTAEQQKASPVSERKSSVYEELLHAPERARARRNPLEKDPEAPLAGRKLFERHCAECHGDNAQGGKKAPSLRAQEVQTATDGALFWLLTNGVVRRGMPVWSKLPEPQRWQLVAYLKTLGTTTDATSQKEAMADPISPRR